MYRPPTCNKKAERQKTIRFGEKEQRKPEDKKRKPYRVSGEKRKEIAQKESEDIGSDRDENKERKNREKSESSLSGF